MHTPIPIHFPGSNHTSESFAPPFPRYIRKFFPRLMEWGHSDNDQGPDAVSLSTCRPSPSNVASIGAATHTSISARKRSFSTERYEYKDTVENNDLEAAHDPDWPLPVARDFSPVGMFPDAGMMQESASRGSTSSSRAFLNAGRSGFEKSPREAKRYATSTGLEHGSCAC